MSLDGLTIWKNLRHLRNVNLVRTKNTN